MDFRKCPACKASVLDDDAAECPFCGASMSGKPSAGPAKPAAQRPAAAAVKGGTTGSAAPAKPSAPGKKGTAATPAKPAPAPKPAEDPNADPFDIDTSGIAQAPAVSRRPEKGKMIRVVCPMCETPGFISEKLQGRDVKCANPSCLVPVFKAPLPEKPAEPDEQPSRGISTWMLGVTAGIVLPLAGVLVWVFVLRDDGGVAGKGITPSDFSRRPVAEEDEDLLSGIAPPAPRTPVLASLQEIKASALEQIVKAAQQREGNRSKPYGRRLAAEAFAEVGQLDDARQQIERLEAVSSGVPFYKIEPLVTIAWQHLQRGETEKATQTLNEALVAAEQFPEVGRTAAAAVAGLAAALVAMERRDDARQVLARLDAEEEATSQRDLVAALVEIVCHLGMFDLDEALRNSSLDLVDSPLLVATTALAAAHGHWSEALAWTRQQADVATRGDCLSVIAIVAAVWSARSGTSAPVETIRAEIGQESPAAQSRALAGMATGQLLTGQPDAARESLALALAAFESVPRPSAQPSPSVKLIYESKSLANAGLGNAGELRSAAVSAAQMARLQFLLGDPAAAWTTLLKAWEFTAGMAPNARDTRPLSEEVSSNLDRARQRLKRELGLKTEDQVFRATNEYRRQVLLFAEAADVRFELEVRLLREAVRWGLRNEVAAMVRNPGTSVPTAARQPYASSSLVRSLQAAFAEAGETGQADEMQQLAERSGSDSDPIAELHAATERLFASGKYLEAAQKLGAFRGGYDLEQRRDLRGLELACRLLKQNKTENLCAFVKALSDPVLTEDGFELTAALSVRLGLAPELWSRYGRENLNATQSVALYRGLIAGIVATGEQTPPLQAAAESKDPEASAATANP
jgi:tetratricopeptide (TPR) repeat protein